MMKKKSRIDSILSRMTNEELRAELLEALSESEGALDRFIAAHSGPEDDLEDPEMIRMIERRAEAIADQIDANIRDQRTMWRIARSRRGRGYLEDDEGFEPESRVMVT